MLRSQQEVRLFGQRYGVVFAGLAIAAAILIVLLILNLPRTPRTAEHEAHWRS